MMTRLWRQGEASLVTADFDQYENPRSFKWHGRTHAIRQVHLRWRVECDWWSEHGEVARDYVLVTTDDNLLCLIYCDLSDRQWYIARLYD